MKCHVIGYDIEVTNGATEMSYCIYNKEFDQFLSLVSNNKHGFVNHHEIKWDDEFNYAFAGLNRINKFDDSVHISTVWPIDMDGTRGNFFVLIYRLIYGQYSEKNHMEHIRFVPITNGIPDFENESAFK